MSDVHPNELMRLLHGELSEERAREIRERLAGDPELARRYRELAAVWERLELPPASPPPLGFAARVTAGVRERAAAEAAPLSWSGTPGWARAAGAAALAAGLVTGVGLGRGTLAPAAPVGPVTPEAGSAVPEARPAVAAAPVPSVVASGPPAAAPGREPAAAAGEPAAAAGTAAPPAVAELADDLGVELPPGLAGDATLTADYWAALGFTGGLEDAGAELDDEEPRS